MEVTWSDPRLSYNGSHFQSLRVPADMATKSWRPDLYFVNDIITEAYNVPSPNVIFNLRHNGYVSYISR